MKWLRLLLVPAALVLVVACGDDDDDSDGVESADEEAEEATGDDGGLVEVEGVEFAFNYDESAITANTAGLKFVNNGQQDHELLLFSLAADVDIEAALAEEGAGLPEGVEQVGGSFAPPGEEGETIEFTEPLEPGRYVMLCFVDDEATGQPHFALGMQSEFAVE